MTNNTTAKGAEVNLYSWASGMNAGVWKDQAEFTYVAYLTDADDNVLWTNYISDGSKRPETTGGNSQSAKYPGAIQALKSSPMEPGTLIVWRDMKGSEFDHVFNEDRPRRHRRKNGKEYENANHIREIEKILSELGLSLIWREPDTEEQWERYHSTRDTARLAMEDLRAIRESERDKHAP